MTLVLDASMAIAWHLKRVDNHEAALAQRALQSVSADGARVPSLWYVEVTNALLVAERRGVSTEQESAIFLNDVAQFKILMDTALPDATQSMVLALARTSKLTAFDAAYLELVLRTGFPLATFDQQLAKVARKAGGRVFGDPA